uniref:Transcription initiation factor TFIID subunit 1 histone acetyltransferase domain-containing protein n=1 Tax=Ditylum brightwellii TaxID=49249 RepID=A0A7S4SER6_9STRA
MKYKKKTDDMKPSYLTSEDHLMMEHPILVSLSKALDDYSSDNPDSSNRLPKGLNRSTIQQQEEETQNGDKVANTCKKIISSPTTPTPILIRNVPRQCMVNLLDASSSSDSSDSDKNENGNKANEGGAEKEKEVQMNASYYGGEFFYKASPDQIKRITKSINPPARSNIAAMTTSTNALDDDFPTTEAVLKKKGKRYTKNEILDLFAMFYTTFRAVVIESSKENEHNNDFDSVKTNEERKRNIRVHTTLDVHGGRHSPPSCIGNKELTAVIQILAAGAAGVENIHFWYNDDCHGDDRSIDNDAFCRAMEISLSCNGCSTEDIVNRLIKTGYRWGDVAHQSCVTFASTTAGKENDDGGGILSLLSPLDDVEMAGKNEMVDAVGEVIPSIVEDMELEEKRREEEEEIELQRAARRDMEFFRMQAERMRRGGELAYELSSRTAEYERHADHVSDEDENGNEKKKKRRDAVLRPSWVGADDDDPERRALLERRRMREEARISPKLHEVELGDWELNIDWEGAACPGGNGGSSVVVGEVDATGVSSSSAVLPPSGSVMVVNRDLKGDKKSSVTDGTAKNNSKAVSGTIPSPSSHSDPLSLLHHPLNISLDALDLTSTISWEGADAPPGYNHAIASRVGLILHESVAGRSLARLATPTHRPEPFTSTAAFGSRCERELNASVTSTAVSVGGSLNPDSEKLEKIIEARQKKRAQMAKDKSNRVTEAMGTLALGGGKGRTITSSLMGPGGTERTGRPSRHADSSSAHDAEYVEQLELVYNHTLVKPDLNKSELRHFHRPRLPARGVVRAGRIWQFQVRCSLSASTSGSKGVASADGSTVVGSYHTMMSAHHGSASHGKIRNEADLSASEGNLVLFEYCEERPPIQMPKGMACKIVNYYRGDKSRCPISAGGGDRPTRKRNWKKSVGGAGQGGPSGKVERPPRLMGPSRNEEASALDLIGTAGSSKANSAGSGPSEKEKEKKAKEPAVDLLPEGTTEILHPKVHGPFMGEIDEGMNQNHQIF